MSDLAQLINGLGLLITALVSAASLIASLRTSRKVDEVHAATNGLSSKLVDLTAKSSLAEGIKQGRDEKGAEIQAQQESQ